MFKEFNDDLEELETEKNLKINILNNRKRALGHPGRFYEATIQQI